MTDVATAAGLVSAEWTRFADALDGAGPDVWDRPTRLADWTVEDLARHVHWGTTLEADGLALAAAASPGPAAGTPLEGPREEIVPALRRSFAALAGCLAQLRDPAGGAVPMPYGDVPMALALRIFVMEAAVHTSDLADAVPVDGRSGDSLPAAARQSCAAVFQAFWPALAAAAAIIPAAGTTVSLVGPTVRIGGTFDGAAWGPLAGEPSVVVEGADDAVLLFAYGRLPFEKADLTVTGDRELAERFKTFVPGP